MNDMRRKAYCTNCGLYNHYYRECKYPITSYGVVCFKMEEEKTFIEDIKYLMIRRRNSLSYVEFLRGRYSNTNLPFLLTLFTNMTINEREIIENNDFDTLWNDLWLNSRRNEYQKARKRFDQMRVGITVDNYTERINIKYFLEKTRSVYTEPEWSFPKGRRNAHEKDNDCANREFIEETNYNINDYEILKNVDTFQEEHLGTNNISYKAVYYIAKFISNDKPAILNPENKTQMSEVGAIGWYTYDEIIGLFRSYHTEKVELITQIHSKLRRIYDQ